MKMKRVITYLFCLFAVMFAMSACGSKSITIKLGGDNKTTEEDSDEKESTEDESVPTVEESAVDETATVPVSEQVPQTTQIQTQAAEPATAMTQVLTTLYVVNCNESITLRTSDSTSAKEIRQIPLGAAVSFMENAANGFYKVSYNGSTGYALASYLSVDPYNHYVASTTAAADTSWTGKVVRCNEFITLRKTPSTKGEEITKIPLGAIVTVYSGADNGFYYINYGGIEGYALASYIDAY
ncbi:MAG: SH3 domain-containing protein [Lachnospiraceae bacterium]|nr:SH3 domain-containing protein [Lachnospiraceae bacterium]